MLRWLLCRHEWVAVASGDIRHIGTGNSLASGAVIGTWTKHTCAKCERIKITKDIP